MLSQDFALAELEVSGEFPNLASPMPSALVPRAKQLVARGLQPVRDQLGRPMRILSGYRSHALNRAVGGQPTSQHLVAEAADWTCEDLRDAIDDVIRMILAGELKGIGQIIYYPDKHFIHMATISGRFPTPTVCIHWPSRKYQYRVVTPLSVEAFGALVPR